MVKSGGPIGEQQKVLTVGRMVSQWARLGHSFSKVVWKELKNRKGEFFYHALHSGTTDVNPIFHNASCNIFIIALTIVMATQYLSESSEGQWSWSHLSLQLSCSRTKMSKFKYVSSSHWDPTQLTDVNRNDYEDHLTELLQRLYESRHEK